MQRRGSAAYQRAQGAPPFVKQKKRGAKPRAARSVLVGRFFFRLIQTQRELAIERHKITLDVEALAVVVRERCADLAPVGLFLDAE